MRVIQASGIFAGVRTARLARAAGGFLELSLDSWEAPLRFEVMTVDRDASGPTVYRGVVPRVPGSREVIAIEVEADTAGDAIGDVRRIEVTRSTEGGAADSVLDIRGTAEGPE